VALSNEQMEYKKNSKMEPLNLVISAIALNVNGLNILIKRQRMSDYTHTHTNSAK
jgi:hypothetical protein